MKEFKEHGSYYKSTFARVAWDRDKKAEDEDITIDADSVIFDEIIKFVKELSSFSNRRKLRIHIQNVFDRTGLISWCIDSLVKRCLKRLQSLTSSRSEMVFGSCTYPNIKMATKKMREEKRREALRSLSTNTNLLDMERGLKTVRLLGRYALTLRDEVRNRTAGKFPDSICSDEPDKYCARRYSKAFSYDYDLFLFGLNKMKRETGGSYQSLSMASIKKQLGFETESELVLACVLQGTDYNRGIKGIGPKRSRNFKFEELPDNMKSELMDAFEYFRY